MIHDKPIKILLSQLFSNGDCLFATAVARQIKSDFPNSHLTWDIARFCSRIIENNPYVDGCRIVDEVPKSDAAAFRKYTNRVKHEKKTGKWDELFITTNMGKNLALYDGTIRGMILGAYPHLITVPVQPVLVLSENEKNRVATFANKHLLHTYDQVILWEYAPQSGQSNLTKDSVKEIAAKICTLPSTCVILSSADQFASTHNIIDASELSPRENAALTHYCTLLIGCSSGITWINTSSAAKFLPMVQLLNPRADFFNPPSLDFKRFGIPVENLIEITTMNTDSVYGCVKHISENGFASAKNKYNEALPLQFNTTRKVVYNLLCYLEFKSVKKHYEINAKLYKKDPRFIKNFLKALVTFPVKLTRNLLKKIFK